MTSKLLIAAQEKSVALVFDQDDEAVAALRKFARDNQVTAAHFTGIGGFSEAVLGYYNWETKKYERIPVREQVEVVSLIGDITLENGEPMIHAHAVVGKRDGTTAGGHLLEGRVRPTLEVVLTESPAQLERKYDEASGLALIKM
jgi:uncharacterized protein